MLNIKSGTKLEYLGSIPFILSDGQQVNKVGDTVFVKSDMFVQKESFRVAEEVKEEKKEVVEEKVEKKQETKATKSTPKKKA